MNLKDLLIEIKIRLDRGSTLVNWFKNVIIIVTAIKIMFNCDLKETIAIGIASVIMVFLIGLFDYDLLKFGQREAELITEKYNYYFKKLKKKLL